MNTTVPAIIKSEIEAIEGQKAALAARQESLYGILKTYRAEPMAGADTPPKSETLVARQTGPNLSRKIMESVEETITKRGKIPFRFSEIKDAVLTAHPEFQGIDEQMLPNAYSRKVRELCRNKRLVVIAAGAGRRAGVFRLAGRTPKNN